MLLGLRLTLCQYSWNTHMKGAFVNLGAVVENHWERLTEIMKLFQHRHFIVVLTWLITIVLSYWLTFILFSWFRVFEIICSKNRVKRDSLIRNFLRECIKQLNRLCQVQSSVKECNWCLNLSYCSQKRQFWCQRWFAMVFWYLSIWIYRQSPIFSSVTKKLF